MITEINESKVFTKRISCKYQLDGSKCNSNHKWNNDKCQWEWKNLKEYHTCRKGYIWNNATCNCENGEYWASYIDDLVITCDEVVNAAHSISTNG